MKPLVIDLFCGLGGWSEAFLAEGYRCIGFDIERHQYGDQRYPAQLVIQDVLTLHGSQFKDAAVIVASPPCQAYSYRAMPWNPLWCDNSRMDDDGSPPIDHRIPDVIYNDLFRACFRIQREASAAAGRHIPMVVENVKGAQLWVGSARWHFGSFYLWGDVPALMPFTKERKPDCLPVLNGHDDPRRGRKNVGGSWFGVAHNTESGVGQNPVNGTKTPGLNWSKYGDPGYKPKGFNVTNAQRYREEQGTKNGNDWFGSGDNCSQQRKHSSRSDSRKAASAQIAKIPPVLAQHIARTFYPG